MIFVRDKGRMCNNILQYGHVYAWAREHGRSSMSMRFAYKYPYFHICDTRWHNFFVYVFAKYAAKTGLLPVVSFNKPGGDTTAGEAFMADHKNVVVEGWYVQFPSLFLKYKGDIVRLFSFHDNIRRKADALVASYGGCVKLGVHIRRGDYARWQDGRYFFSDSQYIHVICQFVDLHPGSDVHVFICGNDPSLDRNAYRQALGSDHVSFPEGNPGEDLCLLSRMDALIGPPSTFSLVASMYRNVPLYWIMDAGRPLEKRSFKHFDDLFTHLI